MKRKVNLLFSGGIDSTACLHFYKENRYNIVSTFIDYGQPSRKKEFGAANKISEYYKVPLKKVTLSGIDISKKDGFIMGRNLFLLSIALLNSKTTTMAIGIGVHFGTNYCDCSESFISDMQNLYDHYGNGTVQISAPFLKHSKNQIYEYCVNYKIPIELTYSCELGKNQPCNQCASCKDLEELNAC